MTQDAFVIETQDRAAGVAVRDGRSGFRFFAAEAPFFALDKRTFRHLRELRSAVDAVAAAATGDGGRRRLPRFASGRA
jgi:hypothetical protein